MPYKLVHVKFSQVSPNTYFTYEGNHRWVKGTWKEHIHEPHNAYRDDYGAEEGAWWKVFSDDDIVQVHVLEV